MSTSRKIILLALLCVLLITVGMVGFGAYLGHNGLFELGAELVKFVFGTVVGALASAFSEKGDGAATPTVTESVATEK
jgi:hypothetical protein